MPRSHRSNVAGPRKCSGRHVAILTLTVATLVASRPVLAADAIATGFQERAFRDDAGEHKYTIFVPTGYTPERAWPVILYLHGSSARGTDNKLPLVGGLAPQVRVRAKTFPFLVVFPQCEDRDARLLDGWLAQRADGKRAIKILDAVEREFNVDRRREILTGWSMGGTGVWSIAAETPSRWSALAVVAGSGNPATASRLVNVPIWAFHGTKDFTVPFDDGRKMAAAVRQAGGKAHFTVLPDVRHNIAHVVYGDDAIYQWMIDPQSEPRGDAIVHSAKRAPNEAEMGHDFVHPFIPAAEIPQSLYARLDKDAIESLAYAVPELVPPATLSGAGADVHQTRRAFMTRFDIALSGITYRGTLERINVTTSNDGWVTVALGVRNMTTEIGSAQINGRFLLATAGPMDIVVGHQRPVWLILPIRPYIAERRLRFELGQTRFEIPDDNWYVTTPQVAVRGFPVIRQRIAGAISSNLVQGTYSRKGEIESQVVAAAPALVQKLEEQLDQKLTATRTLGQWPMPAYQPPFKLWPDRLRVDDSGVSLLVGITVGRPALDDSVRPLRRIERPPVDFDKMPKAGGLSIGVSGAFLEGFTAVVVDAGVAMADALDLHTPEFRALGNRQAIIEAIPDLARFGERLQVRTRLQALEPMLFGAAQVEANSAIAAPADATLVRSQSAVQLQMPHLRVAVDIKTSPDETAWRHCAEFDIRLSQRIELRLEKPDFESRIVRLHRPQKADISSAGRFADGYDALDPTLRTERLTELFRKGWRAGEQMELLQQMGASDLAVGTARLRVAEVGWLEPFLIRRYIPARTRITNGSPQSIAYSIRGPFSEWGGPYTLESGQSHDFPVPYPVTFRQIAPGGAEPNSQPADISAGKTLPMGAHFIFGATAERARPASPAISSAPAAQND